MKKDYIAPDCELIRIKLTRDILGDSKPESPDNPTYGGGGSGEPDDPFGT